MKLILGLVLVLVTFLQVFSQSIPSYDQYCEKCLKKDVVSGFYAHPNRCDAFIHCQSRNGSFIGYEKFCSEGTCFNRNTLNCDWCSKRTCPHKCNQPTKFKSAFFCSKYYTCDSSGFDWNYKTCPPNHRFDEVSMTCVQDSSCSGTASVNSCSVYFKLSKIPGRFWHRTDDGLIEKQCGPGTGFEMETCTCSKKIKVNITKTCLLVDLPLKTNFKEMSHNWYVKRISNVAITNNAARFTFGSSLVIPALINNDLGESVDIQLNVMLARSNNDSYVIVSNGNCKRQATIGIEVENALTSPVIVGFVKLVGMKSPIKIKKSVSLNVWYNIMFGKSLNIIRLEVNGDRQEKYASGHIEKVDSAISIGKPCSSNGFVGSVNDFKITKCPNW
ncbi:uncharacterized protein LOC115219132 [Argonauta hians]